MLKYILSVLILLLGSTSFAADLRHLELDQGWEFRQVGTEKWYSARVPGNVRTDLYYHGLIPEPYAVDGADSSEWVSREDWEYRLTFDLKPKYLNYQHVDLVFEGLDTYADIMLNGEDLFQSENAFRRYEGNVRDKLKQGENEIRIFFRSPLQRAATMRMQLPYPLPVFEAQTDEAAPFLRKPPYQFGTEWSPQMITMGIQGAVYLRVWNQVRIRDVAMTVDSLGDEVALVRGRVRLKNTPIEAGSYQLLVRMNGEEVVAKPVEGSGDDLVQLFALRIRNPKRWWPQGYGEPHLYNLEVQVKKGENLQDSTKLDLGLRTVKLERGTSAGNEGNFRFLVNDEPIFVRCAEMVPADYFLPRAESYEARILNALKMGRNNMVRLTAAGGYGSDQLYEYCDRNGILVWQDLPFSEAMYPDGNAIRKRIRSELAQQVARLRTHPSLVVYAGNDGIETAWLAGRWRDRYDLLPVDSARIYSEYRNLFGMFIPETLSKLDPDRLYLPGYSGSLQSPYSPEEQASDRIDVIRLYPAYPTWLTLAPFAGELDPTAKPDLEDQTFLKSRALGSVGANEILQEVEQRYGRPSNVEGFLALSRLVQADRLEEALYWQQEGMPENPGLVYGHLNAIWPGASGAMVDHAGRAGASYYRAKDHFRDRTMRITQEGDSVVVHLYNEKSWKSGRLRVRLVDSKGKLKWEDERRISDRMQGLRQRMSWGLDGKMKKVLSGKVFLLAEWIEVGEEDVSRVFDGVAPADLKLKEAAFTHRFYKKGRVNYLEIVPQTVVKQLEIQFESVIVPLSDNYIDLIPGQTVVIELDAPKFVPEYLAKKVRFRSLVDWM